MTETQYISEYLTCYTISAMLRLQEIAKSIPGIQIHEARSGTSSVSYRFVSSNKESFHELYAKWDKYIDCEDQ